MFPGHRRTRVQLLEILLRVVVRVEGQDEHKGPHAVRPAHVARLQALLVLLAGHLLVQLLDLATAKIGVLALDCLGPGGNPSPLPTHRVSLGRAGSLARIFCTSSIVCSISGGWKKLLSSCWRTFPPWMVGRARVTTPTWRRAISARHPRSILLEDCKGKAPEKVVI